jgi:hypothetical protein
MKINIHQTKKSIFFANFLFQIKLQVKSPNDFTNNNHVVLKNHQFSLSHFLKKTKTIKRIIIKIQVESIVLEIQILAQNISNEKDFIISHCIDGMCGKLVSCVIFNYEK